ncbi:MAG: response regulator transcription factor [Spirosomataceae bacterium]
MKLLLIEDEPKTIQSLKTSLEANGLEVDMAYDGEIGSLLARKNEYDVIISDIILPYKNGFDIIQEVRESGKQTPIILLTALNSLEEKLRAFDLGADDYLVKPFELKELIARIRVVTKRQSQVQFTFRKLTFEGLELNIDTKTVVRDGRQISLTAKEFSLLECLMRNQGRVLSKEELLDKVWNMDADVTTNVVEVFMNLLRRKIDRDFPEKLIYTIYGMGYVMKKNS